MQKTTVGSFLFIDNNSKSSIVNSMNTSSMKWFDRDEIKLESQLAPDQIGYLKEKSFTAFGPFNILVRKHWDILLALILLRILDEIVMGDDSASSYVLAFVELGVIAWLYYFMIVNGRRLAWNRNNWPNFETFKESENKWTPWGYLVFGITVLIFVAEFIGGYLGL